MNIHAAPKVSGDLIWYKTPMFRFLMVLTIFSTVGVQAYLMLFNNFAVETVGLDGRHIGMLQSVRELPGFLALLAVFAMMIIQEHRLAALSVLLLGVGVLLTGMAPFFGGLVLTTLIMSFGFHYFETTNQSLTLQYFNTATSPKVFGRLKSLAAASNIATGILIFSLSAIFDYTWMYLVIGILVIIAAIWALTQNPTSRHLIPQRKKMVVRRRYGLFYFLTFMAGARRQIFMSFAVLLLVHGHSNLFSESGGPQRHRTLHGGRIHHQSHRGSGASDHRGLSVDDRLSNTILGRSSHEHGLSCSRAKNSCAGPKILMF